MTDNPMPKQDDLNEPREAIRARCVLRDQWFDPPDSRARDYERFCSVSCEEEDRKEALRDERDRLHVDR